ncbi:MAG: energy-coupling factor transporter transmembrane protein EcfT [Oscillospiraceae bacterium]|nr:energy-coupling factor transporter transmembrane protein EcfT [Oscillospiraceae bacterium]
MRDITLGQYINSGSVVHKLDPRLKLVLTLVFLIVIFTFGSLEAMLATAAAVMLLYRVAKIPLKLLRRSLKAVMPIVLFTSVLNMFFVSGDVLVSFWKISITKQGIYFALMLSLRIVLLLAGTSLLTYTTTPIELTHAIELLLGPLGKIGFPVHERAMMMTIALRFIPTLMDETNKIMSAQKSRGATLDTGSFAQRVKALTPILVPLFVSAFRRADELALAMECRCYNGGVGRSRMRALRLRGEDYLALLIFVLGCAAIWSLDYFI